MLREMMVSSGSIFAAFTETHLRSDMFDAEVSMLEYELFRADRVEGRLKGGAALYLKREFARESYVMSSGSNGYVEHVMIHIKQLNLVVINVYRPPRTVSQEFIPIMNNLKEKFFALGRQVLAYYCAEISIFQA